MRRIPAFLMLTALLAFCNNVNAQKTELGILLGASYYTGDIVSTTSFQSQAVHQAGGIFLRHHLNKRFTLRANLMYCRIGAADSNLSDIPDNAYQRGRNLSFYADIFEVSGVVEYNLIRDPNVGRRVRVRLIPYVYGGVGFFYFEPKAVNPVNGGVVDLRPLKTDGLYSPFAVAVPLGFGLRYYINRNWQVGIDIGIRLTTTTHLDDITGGSKYQDPASLSSDVARIMSDRSSGETYSLTGKPRSNQPLKTDSYYIGGLTLTYRLWTGGPGFHGAAVRCPRFY